ncbi:AraC family transcriptional regulator [Paraburkholderia sp.]|uniref:AraC family transcriptional regulator n=1 Tax=Paraburkholderia sp. TaxID=1926495 RepID=UPI003C7998A3
MDPITAALDTCRFVELEAGEAHSSTPWGVQMPPGIWPIVLYVFTGAPCKLSMAGLGETKELSDKSVCLILRGQAHIVQDSHRTRPNQPVNLRNPANVDRFQTLAFGDSPGRGVTSTFFLGVAPAQGFNASLFDVLPDALILDFDELPSWLCNATDAIRTEFISRHPGFRSVVVRHAELIVIDVIRHYIASRMSCMPAWVSLPGGSRVATALREYHRDISRPWTLDMLASVAGTSRSRLIAASQHELGEGIFRYITRFRMQEAARLLKETPLPVSKIARRVGYQSEAAFSIAFKRYSGTQPRQYRRGVNYLS